MSASGTTGIRVTVTVTAASRMLTKYAGESPQCLHLLQSIKIISCVVLLLIPLRVLTSTAELAKSFQMLTISAKRTHFIFVYQIKHYDVLVYNRYLSKTQNYVTHLAHVIL